MPKINYCSHLSNPEFREITIKFREEKSFFHVEIELDDNLQVDAEVEVENGYIRIIPFPDMRQPEYSVQVQKSKIIFDRLIKLPDNVEKAFFKKTIRRNQISLIFAIKTADNLFHMYY